MGEIVAAALRLREINRELDSVHDSAEAMLAGSWRSGEPDVETLTDIRNWGTILNERLRHVTGGDDAWLATVQTMLAESVQQGVQTFRESSDVGHRLVSFRAKFSAFDEAFVKLVTEAALHRPLVDDATDFFSAAEQVLSVFSAAAPRLREINAEFAAGAATAEATLGVLWERGEPAAEALARVDAWGEKLHSRMLTFAGEDIGWLGSFRLI